MQKNLARRLWAASREQTKNWQLEIAAERYYGFATLSHLHEGERESERIAIGE